MFLILLNKANGGTTGLEETNVWGSFLKHAMHTCLILAIILAISINPIQLKVVAKIP
jgi:hypothetical protein